MKIQEKAEIFNSHLLTELTSFAVQDEPSKYHSFQPLYIRKDLILSFSDEDLKQIRNNKVYLSVIFSPGSTSKKVKPIPANSQIISFDFNSLQNLSKRHRIAILLHEYGHAFNPSLSGKNSEFVADDFASDRGYRVEIRELLTNNILDNSEIYDTAINQERIKRLAD